MAAVLSAGESAADPVESTLEALFEERGIIDMRREFFATFCAEYTQTSPPSAPSCDTWLHSPSAGTEPVTDPDPSRLSAKVYLVPGLLGDCVADLVSPFAEARVALEARGIATALLAVGGRQGTAANAAELLAELRREPSGHAVTIAIGYSKGALDLLEALAAEPSLGERLDAVVSLGGPIYGSPSARDVSELVTGAFERLPLPDCERGDGTALNSLHPEARAEWLARHDLRELPVRLYAVAAYATPDRISWIMRGGARRLLSHGPNDGQVVLWDALPPASTLLALVDADHWAMALPFAGRAPWLARTLVNRNRYPRAALLTAVVDTILADVAAAD